MKSAFCLVSAAITLVSSMASAQTPVLLVDATTEPEVRDVVSLDAVGDRILVGVTTSSNGQYIESVRGPGDFERLLTGRLWTNALLLDNGRAILDTALDLYVTDGSPEATFEIDVDAREFMPFYAAELGERILFSTASRFEPSIGPSWSVGANGNDPVEIGFLPPLFVRGDEGFFGRFRCELWKTDGTQLRTEFAVAPAESLTEPLERPDCDLYERPDDTILMVDRGGEIAWSTDGTLSGTERVDHLAGGFGYGFIGPNIYFLKLDMEQQETALIVSDGSPNNTNEVARFPGVERSRFTTVVGSRYVFEVRQTQGLVTTDGTAQGTLQFVQFAGRDSWPVQVGSTLYFVDVDTVMATNGTEEGTRPVATFDPLSPGPNDSRPYAASERGVAVVQDGRVQLFDAAESDELWPADERVRTRNSTIVGFWSIDDYVLFGTQSSDAVSFWRTDGTPSGTESLGSLESAREVETALPGDRTLLRGRDGFLVFDNANPVDVRPLQTPPEPEDGFVTSIRFMADDEHAFLLRVESMFPPDAPPSIRLVIARLVGDRFEREAELESEFEQFGAGLLAWLEDGNVVVEVAPSCERRAWDGSGWTLIPSRGVCLATPPLAVDARVFEWVSDHLVVDGERIWSGEVGDAPPVKVGDTVFFIGRREARESLRLYATDGTETGTTIVAEGVAESSSLLVVGDAVVWQQNDDGQRSIHGFRAESGAFRIVEQGRVRLGSDPTFAWVSEKLVFARVDPLLGTEAFSVDFERSELPADEPESTPEPSPDAGGPEGGLDGSGCGCATTSPAFPGAIFLLVVGLLTLRRRRRCGANHASRFVYGQL